MGLKANFSVILLVFVVVLTGCEDKNKFNPKVHFEQRCSICHENKEMQRGPNLFGLNSYYLEHQMKVFQFGIRGSEVKNKSEALMGSAKLHLPQNMDRQILAQWISEQKQPQKYYNLKGDSIAGQQLAQACLACHQVKGNHALPNLLKLEPWYILDQLRKFKAGRRGYHEKDHAGQLMKAYVQPLEDSDLKRITLHLQRLMKENSEKKSAN